MKQERRQDIWIALAVALAVTLLIGAGSLKRLDRWTQDALFQRPSAQSPDVVIIGIDENALEALGPYNSWSRSIMASALEVLAADPAKQPAVVAIDTLYAGESDPESDARLAEAAGRLNVVTATAADLGVSYLASDALGVDVRPFSVLAYEEPFPALRDATAQGHINAMYDLDGVMRHGLLYLDVPDGAGGVRRVWSMAAEAARRFTGSDATPVTDQRGLFYIPFSGAPGDYYDGVSLAALINGEVSPDYYAGKLVLIGPYAVGLQDAYYTPVDRGRQMYGVELQANVIQSFLEGDYKRELPDWPQLAALLALSFVLSLVFLRLGVGRAALLAVAAIALSLGASLLLYFAGVVTHPMWLPAAIVAAYILSVVRHYVLAALARQRVTRTFERYVAPEIVREILKEGTDQLKLGGELRDIAVLFVDIRGFTTMSERLPPEKVVFILNQYLAMTSACIERYGGTLDKFIGDATMAFWGAPLGMEDPVGHAARTAIDIVRGADALSQKLKREIDEELRVGIGIHYGPAVVGNMGSERRMDYTAIGDTVNTSARLEANAPSGTIYISRAAADALGARAKVKSLGNAIKLKGKAEGFEVLILEEMA